MPEPDMFDHLQAGREALRRIQESFARYAMPPEQRQALLDGMSQIMFPADGVRAMSDFIDAFGPPLAQIEALRSELAEQREQLSQLDDRLAHLEVAAERLAGAGEQLVAFQEPFLRMAGLFTGQDLLARRDAARAADADDAAEDEDEPADAAGDEAGSSRTGKSGQTKTGSGKSGGSKSGGTGRKAKGGKP